MTPQLLVENIEFLISIGLIVWFFYGPWQNLILDTTRQQLFEIRDSIFSMAADGKIDFESNEYKEIRRRFNSLIRFCHTITWPQAVALIMSGENLNDKQNADGILETIKKIQDEGARSQLLKKRQKSVEIIILTMWLRSPFLMVITMMLLPFLILQTLLKKRVASNVRESIRKTVQRDIDLSTAH